MRASKRGLRTSLGTRAARVYIAEIAPAFDGPGPGVLLSVLGGRLPVAWIRLLIRRRLFPIEPGASWLWSTPLAHCAHA